MARDMAKIYHRKATGNENQDFYTAISQVSSGEIWGGLALYGSAFPTVRAFPGPLPEGRDGVEFETDVPPSPGSPRSEVYWKLHASSPQVLAADGDFARIPVKIRKVRYAREANLKPRCEWKPK